MILSSCSLDTAFNRTTAPILDSFVLCVFSCENFQIQRSDFTILYYMTNLHKSDLEIFRYAPFQFVSITIPFSHIQRKS